MNETINQVTLSIPGRSAVYRGPEDALRALELLLHEMRCGTRDPEEVKRVLEAAGEAYCRAVDYCIDADDVEAGKRMCRVMGITAGTPVGRLVVDFLKEKAEVLSKAERTGDTRAKRYGDCYGDIIKSSGRLYDWLYHGHRGALTGEAGEPVAASEKQADEAGAPAAASEKRLDEAGAAAGVMTAQALKYFPEAIKAGFMVKNGEGYKWGDNARGDKARLAYFLKCVYDPTGSRIIPFKALGELFGVQRLDVALDHVMNTKGGRRQKWRAEIDSLFSD